MDSIALLNIGSELLTGRTVNTNASTMATLLRQAGFNLKTTVVCHDTHAEIRGWLDELLEEHEVVLVTGGLGPTRDDVTKKVLLDRFGGEMVCHDPTLKMIEGYLLQRGRKLLESNRLQAYVPSSCEVLVNKVGTAPGMAFSEGKKTVISMPGVPTEMRYLMRHGAIPLLLERYAVAPMLTRVIRTMGIPESRVGEKIEVLDEELAGIDVAFLPAYDGTKIELRRKINPANREQEEARMDQARDQVANLFAKYLYSIEDKTPDELLAAYLKETGTSFGTAESCTGGAIAASLVQHSGISSVLKGGVVAYMRSIKESVLGVKPETIDGEGIVSEGTAREMAEGARKLLQCDVAVSITGIAEAPADAPPAELPQAWIGYADAQGSEAIHVKLLRHRKQNIEVATNAALVYVLRKLNSRRLD